MKLKDWDDEDEKEEKVRRPKKGSAQRRHPDFGGMDPEDGEPGHGDFRMPDSEDGGLDGEFEDSRMDSGETLRRSRQRNLGTGARAQGGDAGRDGRPDRGTGLRHGTDTGTAQGLRKKSARLDEDMEQEEELAPLPVWAKVLIFIGLAVLAAIICAILWRFVHPDRSEENRSDSVQNTEASGDLTSQSQDLPPVAENQSGAASESGSQGQPDQNPEATTDPGTASAPESPDSTQRPAGDQSPADDRKPGQGQNSESDTPPEASGSQQAAGTASPSDTTASFPDTGAGSQETSSGNTGMTFTAVQESVTPKDAVNLRTAPNTADDANIVTKIQNGEALVRIGINRDTGWSQIDYNGQTVYAVSQYLTTDLNYKTPVTPADPNRVTTAGGVVVIFENCDDWVSPKEYVNLRTEPSTVQENATVSCRLNYGEKAHRTGFSEDYGWSRVEYNGQVLYVVTSFVYVVPEE